MNPEDENEDKSLPFRLAWLATVLWTAFFALLLVHSQRCGGAEANPWYGLLANHIACRTANEVGDTVAGFFAPIAFFFVAAAVSIQAQELHAQKIELRRTTAAQREQAITSNEQLAALLDDKATRERQAVDDEVFSLIALVAAEIHGMRRALFTIKRADGGTGDGFVGASLGVNEPIAVMRAVQESVQQYLVQAEDGAFGILPSTSCEHFGNLLSGVVAKLDQMSMAGQNKLASSNVIYLASDLSKIAKGVAQGRKAAGDA